MSTEPSFEQMLAWSMDAEPELLPYLPALFQDLEELGARVDEVLRVLAKTPVPREGRVLDLGCGKGAVALGLAEKFGCAVHGIDGMAAFVDHATRRAEDLNLADRCRFATGDVREAVQQSRDYDLVCLNALGDTLGSLDEAVGALRECVVEGGLILIDDAYLKDGVEPDEDLVYCYDHATTLGLLTAHGDEVLEELIVDGPESAEHYRRMTTVITARAEELAQQHPEAAPVLQKFAARQADEVDLLTGPVVGALWLLRRTAPTDAAT